VKTWKISALLGVALLATAAFAANKASVQFSDPVAVGGKALAAGNYTVTWEGNGPNVDVSIAHGKEVVAKTSARLLDLPKASNRNALVTKSNPDGTRSLTQIQLEGKKFALELGESTSQADASAMK
jgi:hypothetical protein